MIEVIDLEKHFGDNEVLKGINVTVDKGDIMVVIGPSGSGKSTFLRCLNCMEDPTGGQIIFNGVDIADMKVDINVHRRHMGMVFQHFNLFPHLSVLENVTEAMIHVLKKSKEKAEKEGIKILTRMGLEAKINQYPCNLSGGEQQRASIARTLAINPKIIFMDEPTSALDPELVGEVLKVVKQLASEKRTMVIVTHEISFAREIADRVIFMSNGEIIEQGKPEEVIDNPTKERTKEFLKRYLK